MLFGMIALIMIILFDGQPFLFSFLFSHAAQLNLLRLFLLLLTFFNGVPGFGW